MSGDQDSQREGDIVRLLLDLCNNSAICDVTLVCDDGKIFAHKVVLLNIFPDLRSLLCSKCHDDHNNLTLILPGVDKDSLQTALKNLYVSSDFVILGNILGFDDNIHPLVEKDSDAAESQNKNVIDTRKAKDAELDSTSKQENANVREIGESTIRPEITEADLFAFSHQTRLEKEMLNCDMCGFETIYEQDLLEHKYNHHKLEKCPEELCSLTTFDKFFLKAHIFIQHVVQMFCCDLCDFEAGTGKILITHKETVHSSLEYNCNQCQYKNQIQNDNILDYTIFISHKLYEHGNQMNLFQCDKCDYKTTNENNYKKHKCVNKRAGGIKKRKRERLPLPKDFKKCNLCDYAPKKISRVGMKVHMESVHLGIKHYCKECDFVGSTRANIFKHMRAVHEGRKFKCDECEFTSHIKKVVSNHKAYTHEGISHKCSICDYVGKSAIQLVVHTRWSHEERKFVCSACDTKFPYLTNMRKHIKMKHTGLLCSICQHQTKDESNMKAHNDEVHNGIEYPCQTCKYKGVTKLTLELHKENNHEPLQTSPRFPCKQCDYASCKKAALKHHYLVKHEGKRFHCSQCDFKAKSKVTIKSHRSVVHEGKTFDCKQCEFKCLSYANLRNHKLAIHDGILNNCDKCDFIGNSIQSLASHKKQKHEPDVRCEKCDFRCRTPRYLKDHMLKKHELDAWLASQGLKALDEPHAPKRRTRKYPKSLKLKMEDFKCEKCDFETKYLKSLNDHMLSKHVIQDIARKREHQRLFKCSNCNFTSEHKQQMESHIVKAHPCECNQCEFKSGYIDELKVHIIEEHSGNYCEPCSFQSQNERELQQHNNFMHGGIPYPCEKCGYCAPSQISLLAHIEKFHDVEENDASFNSFFSSVSTGFECQS